VPNSDFMLAYSMEMRDDDFLNEVLTDVLDREDILGFLRKESDLQQLIQDLDVKAPEVCWQDRKYLEVGLDLVEGTPLGESPSTIENQPVAVKRTGKKHKASHGKRTRLTRACKKRSLPCTQLDSDLMDPSQRGIQLKTLAARLQKVYAPFSSLNEDSIVDLLKRGARIGIQPKVPPFYAVEKSTDNVPLQSPKRIGQKRGAYKLKTRDSWTSCSSSGESLSGTALHNAIENMRNPIARFKERVLLVNEIEFCQESAGTVEVRVSRRYCCRLPPRLNLPGSIQQVPAFEEYTLTARDYTCETGISLPPLTGTNIGIDAETVVDASFDTFEVRYMVRSYSVSCPTKANLTLLLFRACRIYQH
jgi:hypothetical protein